MASAACSPMKSSILCKCKAISLVGPSSFPLHLPRAAKDIYQLNRTGSVFSERLLLKGSSHFLGNGDVVLKKVASIPKSNISSNSSGTGDESSNQDKTPFGYTRKDVLLIGVGVTIIGVGLKSGLEFFGVDPLQAGNVVQLVVVLGLTVGWISTYIFRVSNKDMTYTKQLRDYENKVMEKRLESLTEAELQALLEQVEEEKTRLGKGEQGK